MWRTTSRRWSGRRRSSRSTRSSAARTRTRTTSSAAFPARSISTSANALNAERLAYVGTLFDDAADFVEQVYIPDLLAVAGFYKDWGAIGGGLENYLAYGDLPVNGYGDPSKFKFPRGVILNRNLAEVLPVDGRDVDADPGVHRPFLVRVLRRRRHRSASLGRRNETQLHGPKPPYELS